MSQPSKDMFETTIGTCTRHGDEVFCRLKGSSEPHVCAACLLSVCETKARETQKETK